MDRILSAEDWARMSKQRAHGSRCAGDSAGLLASCLLPACLLAGMFEVSASRGGMSGRYPSFCCCAQHSSNTAPIALVLLSLLPNAARPLLPAHAPFPHLNTCILPDTFKHRSNAGVGPSHTRLPPSLAQVCG